MFATLNKMDSAEFAAFMKLRQVINGLRDTGRVRKETFIYWLKYTKVTQPEYNYIP